MNTLAKINTSYPSLYLALEKLFSKQEKSWGYFQVHKKDDGIYYLQILGLPRLTIYQNEESIIYRVFWLTDSKEDKKPDIFIRKKQKKIYLHGTKQEEKMQKIYEIVIYHKLLVAKDEIKTIDKIIAQIIKEKIEQKVNNIIPGEVKPLVIVTEEN